MILSAKTPDELCRIKTGKGEVIIPKTVVSTLNLAADSKASDIETVLNSISEIGGWHFRCHVTHLDPLNCTVWGGPDKVEPLEDWWMDAQKTTDKHYAEVIG